MAPTPKTVKGSSKLANTRYCGLGNHRLEKPYKTIDDPYLLRFAKKLNVELRASSLICSNCLELLKDVYKHKLDNAIHHHKVRQESKGNSVSDVSSSQRPDATSESSESQNQFLTLAIRDDGNVNKRYRGIHKEASTIVTSTRTSTPDRPTTSAAAAALAALKLAAERQQRTTTQVLPEPDQSTNSTTDDDEPLYSLNAFNGTRLPHIQPIPKRQQTKLTGPQQDIYLAGITGG